MVLAAHSCFYYQVPTCHLRMVLSQSTTIDGTVSLVYVLIGWGCTFSQFDNKGHTKVMQTSIEKEDVI